MNEWSNMTAKDAKNFMRSYHNDIENIDVLDHSVQPEREWLAKRCQDGTVLDVGCGKAFEVDKYYDPEKYLGVDFSKALLSEARKAHPKYKFQFADGTKLPFKNNQFDYAISKGVIDHLPSEEIAGKMYDELIRVSKTAIIMWHFSPHHGETEIGERHGFIPDPIFEAKFSKKVFDRVGVTVESSVQGNFEFWTIT